MTGEIFTLSRRSLANRRVTTFLTVFAIALSIVLLLGIERIRKGTRESFESTISKVDLIVGARGGAINLLLYSVFRMGDPVNNLSWESFKKVRDHEEVKWIIPISLGDSHRGYRVVGTNQDYFKHYRYAGSKSLKLAQGKRFESLFDVVIGHDVARRLQYKPGDRITLSHGTAAVSFQNHDDKPFVISGILAYTGTPVDKSLHVSLEAIEALHVDWQNGAPPLPGQETSPDQLLKMNLTPKTITAAFVRLRSKIGIFHVQREINENEDEAMSAVLPGITLRQLWSTLGVAEKALQVVSWFVFAVSLISMLISLLTTLNERRREMAILRSVGASARFIFTLLLFEAALLAAGGIALGIGGLYTALWAANPILEKQLGLTVGLYEFSSMDMVFLGIIFIGALIVAVLPAWNAYRKSLADGLVVRL
jgi:putative ABC transport system permease protein